MIHKIVAPGAGFRGALAYVLDPGKGYLLDRHFVSGEDEATLARELGSTRRLNENVGKPVFHASIRLPPGERLTDAEWRRVAERYMEHLGYGGAPYVVARHTDRPGGDHIHLIASRIGLDGRRVSDSHERRRGMEVLRELERELGLAVGRSPGEAQERPLSSRELRAALRTGEPNLRLELQELLREAARGRPGLDRFAERLRAEGVEVHLHAASTGRIYGVSYRFEGVSFRGSDLGKAYSWQGLQGRLGVAYDPIRDAAMVEAARAREPGRPGQGPEAAATSTGRDPGAAGGSSPGETGLWSRAALDALAAHLAGIHPHRGRSAIAGARQALLAGGSTALRAAAGAVHLAAAVRSPHALALRALRQLPAGSRATDLFAFVGGLRSPLAPFASTPSPLAALSRTLAAGGRLARADGPRRPAPEAALLRTLVRAYVEAAAVDAPPFSLLTRRLAAAGIEVEAAGRRLIYHVGGERLPASHVGAGSTRSGLERVRGVRFDVEPAPAAAGSAACLRPPALPRAPAARLRAEVGAHLRALGEGLFDLMLVPPGGGGPPEIRLRLRPEQIVAGAESLLAEVGKGASVLLRPARESHLQLVRAGRETVAATLRSGLTPAAVVELPGGGRELWLRHAREGGSADPRLSLYQGRLARLALGLPPTDPGSSWGHLAGLGAAGGGPARLIHAGGEPYPLAPALRARLGRELAALDRALEVHLAARGVRLPRPGSERSLPPVAWAARALGAGAAPKDVLQALASRLPAASPGRASSLETATRRLAIAFRAGGFKPALAARKALGALAAVTGLPGGVLAGLRIAHSLIRSIGREPER